MDKALLIGILGAIGLIVAAIKIAGAPFKAFWDTPSIVMVIGGAVMATLTAFPLGSVFGVHKLFLKALMPKTPEAEPVINQLVQFAEIARKDGILALEGRMGEVSDPFFKSGLQMAIDGTDAAVMEAVLRTDLECMVGRHKTGKSMLDTLNKYAPAWGMIGTLVGLVIMLGNMSDPNAIGPGMAVALLTTLYGAMISNMICAPVGDKLAYFSKREIEVREIVIRGILAIQAGDNPRIIEQKLKTFLAPNRRGGEAKAA
jgi:chemotaxis protein MotA